jgi:CheY-like chemotaxis protein
MQTFMVARSKISPRGLTRHKIPFVFVTGYGRAGLPAGFGQAPVLAKPVSDEQLLEAVTTLAPNSRKVVHLKS